jgi:hypothetical protein
LFFTKYFSHLGGNRLGEDCIESILAVHNPTLLNSFVSKWNGMGTRVEMNSSLFNKDFRDKEIGNEEEIENIRQWNLLREETYSYYEDNTYKSNIKTGNNPSLIPVCGD